MKRFLIILLLCLIPLTVTASTNMITVNRWVGLGTLLFMDANQTGGSVALWLKYGGTLELFADDGERYGTEEVIVCSDILQVKALACGNFVHAFVQCPSEVYQLKWFTPVYIPCGSYKTFMPVVGR